LSVTVSEFPIPTTGSNPLGITSGPDGNLWFTEDSISPSQIAEINPTTHVVSEFPTPTKGGGPFSIAAGRDGNLWFTEGVGDKIGQINPTTHAIAEFLVPTSGSFPLEITSGPDGNLWFTENSGNQIGQINPATHAVSEFPIPTKNSNPSGITSGPNSNLWFTEQTGNNIGEINPSTHAIKEFPIPTANSQPTQITVGPNGNLWFTEVASNKIGQINPSTGAVEEFAVPTSGPGGSHTQPDGITAGPDGNLWFTFLVGGFLGEISPSTHAIAEYPFTLPVTAGGQGAITTGPDGNLWFVQEFSDSISQAVVTGPEVTVPDLALSGIASGSATLGSNVTYTLTVSNNGTASATGVTLTATLPAGVTFISAAGAVTPVGRVLTFNLGSLNAGAAATVSIVVAPTVPGELINQAGVSMNQTDPTPADNSLSEVTTVTPTVRVDGPTVIAVRLAVHKRLTTPVLTFDKPLDPGPADNLANYRLVVAGGSQRAIRIKEAVYDTVSSTVTLRLARRLNLHRRYRLTVVGTGPSGVTDTDGNRLDGANSGEPGSNFVTIIGATGY
jgi:uncharacterized repeat protein (TIGR01451 family)